MLLKGLEARYRECISEKNSILIRYDIIQGFRDQYDGEAVKNKEIRAKALESIETEIDLTEEVFSNLEACLKSTFVTDANRIKKDPSPGPPIKVYSHLFRINRLTAILRNLLPGLPPAAPGLNQSDLPW